MVMFTLLEKHEMILHAHCSVFVSHEFVNSFLVGFSLYTLGHIENSRAPMIYDL